MIVVSEQINSNSQVCGAVRAYAMMDIPGDDSDDGGDSGASERAMKEYPKKVFPFSFSSTCIPTLHPTTNRCLRQ